MTNVWNRLYVTTRQVAGEWAKSAEAQKWKEDSSAADWAEPAGGHRDGTRRPPVSCET
jgi:hypothetical protein